MSGLHPWNVPLWQRLVERREKLPHGILISGAEGTGKTALGMELARYLACRSPGLEQPCGACRSCLLFASGTLPDFHLLSSEFERERMDQNSLFYRYAGRYLAPEEERRKRTKPRRVVSIDQIRSLITSFGSRSHTSRHKVAMLAPAESMTLSAANSLLKLLEEPPEESVLILVSSDPGRLPATIRSRCMTVKASLPALEEALHWLQRQTSAAETELALRLSGGAPLAARKIVGSGFISRHPELVQQFERLLAGTIDPVATAAQWQREEFPMLLLWLQRLVVDTIRQASGVSTLIHTANRSAGNSGKGRLQRLYSVYDSIGRFRQMAQDQINPQLALEELLLFLQECQHNDSR